MKLVEMNWQPSVRQLRQFGLIALLALPALGWLWSRNVSVVLSLAAIGGLLALLGLLAPRSLRLVFIGLSLAALPIGLIVSEIALAIIYYLVVTPVGMIARLTGRDRLELRFRREQQTYWRPKPQAAGPDRYFRQS